MENFAIKDLNIEISPGICLIKKENSGSNICCKFQLHSMQSFFKMTT